MSDLVRYAAGNTSGRDHLQWPTILRSEIPTRTAIDPGNVDRVWPVDITLDQAMALAWRVKKLRLTGEINAAINDTSGNAITGHAEISDDAFLYVRNASNDAATRERDLVGQVLVGFDPFTPLVNGATGVVEQIFSNWNTVDIFTTLGGNFSGAIPIGPGFFGAFVLFDPDTGLFTPDFGFGPNAVVPGAVGIGNQLNVDLDFQRSPQTILSGTGPLLLKAPGVMHVISDVADDFDVPIEISWRFQNEGPDTYTGTADCDLTLQAEEWWAFEDSNGDPVYDQFSGDLIRDPFG